MGLNKEPPIEDYDECIRRFAESIPNDVTFIESGKLENTLGLARRVHWIFRPSNKEILRGMLLFFKTNKIAFHPVSTGKNWGLGSKLPPKDDVVILSLDRLNRILEFNHDLGVIRIEPGVTQQQVYEFLTANQSSFYLDVTGSGKETSLVGNALERGISYRVQRTRNVLGVEVLTVNGQLLRTGFGQSEYPIAHLYPYGIGPDISGLFFQSAYGVVTEMTLALPKRAEVTLNITANTSTRQLSDFFKALIALLQDNVIDFVPHIADKNRFVETAYPIIQSYIQKNQLPQKVMLSHVEQLFKQEFLMSATISGSSMIVKEKIKIARKILRPHAEIMVMTPLRRKLIQFSKKVFGPHRFSIIFDALQGLSKLSLGVPTDDAIFTLCDHNSTNPDESKTGFKYVAPVGPLTSETALAFYEINHRTKTQFKAKTAITLNPISRHVLECVFSVTFDKSNPADKRNAENAALYFFEACNQNGFYVYRLPTALPQKHNYHSPEHVELLTALKKYFDPDELLSPGR